MKRFFLYTLLVAVAVLSIFGAASVSQRTQGACGNAVYVGKGTVTITCTGIDAAELNKLIGLFNSSVQITKEFYQKTLETLAKKELNTEEIQAVIALRYKAIFASAEEDAERWGKRLDSASDRQSEVDSLAVDSKRLGERISLKWTPVYDFILKVFDDRALQLENRGLLKPSANPANSSIFRRSLDLIAVDRPRNQRLAVREVRFPNTGVIRVLIKQAQVHRGRFIDNMRLWIEESVNGVSYMPLNMFFDMKMVTFNHQSETGSKRLRGGDGHQWENDFLNNEQFRSDLSLAIGQSLEFIYMNDRVPTK